MIHRHPPRTERRPLEWHCSGSRALAQFSSSPELSPKRKDVPSSLQNTEQGTLNRNIRAFSHLKAVWLLYFLSLYCFGFHWRTFLLMSNSIPRIILVDSELNKPEPLLEKITSALVKIRNPPKTHDEEHSCWRRCPRTRRNNIVVNFPHSAGLNDRYYIMDRLANIAGYLCANLHIPAPATFLASEHNRGTKVRSDADWSDFQNWTWAMNDRKGLPISQRMYYIKEDIMTVNKTLNLYLLPAVQPVVSQLGKSFLQQPWYSTLEIAEIPTSHIVSENDMGWEQFLKLEQIVRDQEKIETGNHTPSPAGGFLWEINKNPYQLGIFDTKISSATMLERNTSIPISFPKDFSDSPNGCEYITKGNSVYVDKVVERVWTEVHDPNCTMGFLHIRRGDSTNMCNTTITKMRSFFNCTFHDTIKYGNIVMLLGTDETDPLYLREIKSVLEDMYPHVKLVHLDPVIEKHIEYFRGETEENSARFLNNFFTFSVANAIRWKRAAFSFEQRRSVSCEDCIHLSSWHTVNWVGRDKNRNQELAAT